MKTFRNATLCIVALLLPSTVLAQVSVPDAPKRTAIVASGARLIPGAEVKTMFLGNTVYWVNLATWRGSVKGLIAPIYYRDERTRMVRYQNRFVEVIWWMEGDAICNEMADKGNRSCALIYEAKDFTYSCNRDEDICRGIIRVMPGNVEKL